MHEHLHEPRTRGGFMNQPPVRVLALAGEYRSTSKSGMLAHAALNIAKAAGAEVEFWDLDASPLPLVGEDGCWSHPNVAAFQAAVTNADAVFLSSPEYHGTMSGVMKNTLDWMYDKHVGGKAVGLMSTLGGVTNANTLNHMRIACRWLHAWPVPEQLAVGHVKEAFNEDGTLMDPAIVERLEKLVHSVLATATMLRDRT